MNMKGLLLAVGGLVVSVALIGCAGNDGEALDQGDGLISQSGDLDQEVNVLVGKEDYGLKERADAEGVSEKEMALMVETLTELTAEKFGKSPEAYEKELENQGKTAFEEFALAADRMGISMKEYVDYEKTNVGSMSQDQKDTLAGMASALEEVSDMDMDSLTEGTEEALDMMEGLMSSGDRVVTGDYKDFGHYKVKEIIEEVSSANGDTSVYMVTYASDAEAAEIMAYYKGLLEGTPDYLYLEAPEDMGGQILGTLNGRMIALTVAHEEGDSVTVVDYVYTGDFNPEVD